MRVVCFTFCHEYFELVFPLLDSPYSFESRVFVYVLGLLLSWCGQFYCGVTCGYAVCCPLVDLYAWVGWVFLLGEGDPGVFLFGGVFYEGVFLFPCRWLQIHDYVMEVAVRVFYLSYHQAFAIVYNSWFLLLGFGELVGCAWRAVYFVAVE